MKWTTATTTLSVLREALARDRVGREREQGRKLKKGTATSEVKAFIQNVQASASGLCPCSDHFHTGTFICPLAH
jgi:hypothetical protein